MKKPGLLLLILEVAGCANQPKPSDPPHLVEPLTDREREIMQLIATGCSNQAVALTRTLGLV